MAAINGPAMAAPKAPVVSSAYTLSSNGKQNQTPLTLLPGSTSVKSGKSLKISTTGGSGKGKIKFSRIATGGAKRKLTPTGKKAKLRVTANSGVCKIMRLTQGGGQGLQRCPGRADH
jgi:hypothetical protein